MNPDNLGKKIQKARELLRSGNFAEALSLYAILVKQFPQGGLEYGNAAMQSGDLDLGNRILEKVRSREPNNAKLLAGLAEVYGNWGLHEKYRALLSEAANLESGNLDLQIKLAAFLTRTNSVEEARPAVNRCLELDSRNELARSMAAHLDRRENKLTEAEGQFRELLASDLKQPQVRYSCYSELAHILDKTGRFDEAMAQLEQGKNFARQALNLTAERKAFHQHHEGLVRYVQSLPKNVLETRGKSFPPGARSSVNPVAFLTGSSRSGTTLLEKVLDAHPGVAACDESIAFGIIPQRIDTTAPAIAAQRLNVTREHYVKNFATVLGMPVTGKTLLDKNPAQTVWLPAFLRAFPELRVLIALRDPRDILISLYFQDHRNTNYFTFEQLAQHYAAVMDVWLAIREWEGLTWMETRYEDMVADLEKEGGRVTRFLGLEWHENQARFYERNREKTVLSNNYSDVTQPVYKRAVGRWRVYEKQLAPVLPILEPYCRKFGYE